MCTNISFYHSHSLTVPVSFIVCRLHPMLWTRQLTARWLSVMTQCWKTRGCGRGHDITPIRPDWGGPYAFNTAPDVERLQAPISSPPISSAAYNPSPLIASCIIPGHVYCPLAKTKKRQWVKYSKALMIGKG